MLVLLYYLFLITVLTSDVRKFIEKCVRAVKDVYCVLRLEPALANSSSDGLHEFKNMKLRQQETRVRDIKQNGGMNI